jgi:hypothetical protein
MLSKVFREFSKTQNQILVCPRETFSVSVRVGVFSEEQYQIFCASVVQMAVFETIFLSFGI